MPPPPHAKPENILKRAHELVAVNKNLGALELLHDHVTSKRTRNSAIASLEPVMLLFVELCVSLRKGKTAKEGLYSYKNIAQNTSVQTIELVLKKFIELAEQKVTEAQERAEQITLDLIDDLEASETPESILLSTVSGEQSRDRTDRAVVTPWLKFLWETYRTVLDILRNNARLEIMYQSTALQAFQFCLKYTRKTEFRRLCELLRNHVQNAAKYSTQMHAINLNDPDTLQRHLDTRFQQLNVAVELELWQEAFRSVEDIHTLLNLSKRPAKNVMMANYYEKLTRIFLVSDNFLFHAAAWSRYYNLLRTSAAQVASQQSSKKDSPACTEADLTRAASLYLLSALSIPVISQARSKGALLDVDEAKRNKNTRLTNLLGMAKAPTRAGLFKDAISKGLLKRAKPEIRDLYTILEVDFHPLSICKKISPILEQIAADAEMKAYVQPLQQVILTRLFQQLSQVYDTVQLDFVINLASFPEPFEVTPSVIEKFIMNGCKKGDLSIRIDHAAGVLTFESDIFSSTKPLHPGASTGSAEKETSSVQKLQSTPSEIVRTQLTRLAKALYLTCSHVDPEFQAARAAAKSEAYARAEAGAEKEREQTLGRRTIIEKKKEAVENALLKKEKEEADLRAKKLDEARKAEAARVEEQQKKRELERLRAEQEKIRQEELKKQLEELALDAKIDVENLSELDSNQLRAMKVAQLEKEKKEMSDKLRITGKRIDHLERAYRREEGKILPQDFEKQRAEDLAAYELKKSILLANSKKQHEEAVALKKRLGRLVGTYETFRDSIKQQRHQEFEKRRKDAEKQMQAEMEKRRKEFRAEKERKRLAQEAAERKRLEEEARLAKEEEERIKKEEEMRERMLKEKEEREERRRKMDEIAAKQRQREEEVEERRTRERQGRATAGRAPPPVAAAAAAVEQTSESATAWRPSGGWRERAAAKEARGSGTETPTAPPVASTNGEATPAPSAERRRLNVAPRTLPKEDLPNPPRVATPPAAAASPAPEKETLPPAKPGAYRPGGFGRKLQDIAPPAADAPPVAEPKGKYVLPSQRRGGARW
ncbi:eukaryotic translation initiation factor 3 subunit A [Rhizina undulata]